MTTPTGLSNNRNHIYTGFVWGWALRTPGWLHTFYVAADDLEALLPLPLPV